MDAEVKVRAQRRDAGHLFSCLPAPDYPIGPVLHFCHLNGPLAPYSATN